MPYYKGMIRIGHYGFTKVFNTFYVHADDILQAMKKIKKKPTTHHRKMPIDLKEVSEDEFIINDCINPYAKQYDNKIVTLTSQEIKKHIIPVLKKERLINKNYRGGKLANTLINIVNDCKNSESEKERSFNEKALENWLIYNYEHQDEILGKTENVEEKEM